MEYKWLSKFAKQILQTCAEKGTVLLSTSLEWPATAGCSRAETVSQLRANYFAQPCRVGKYQNSNCVGLSTCVTITMHSLLTVFRSEPQRSGSSSSSTPFGGQRVGQTHFPASQRPPSSQLTPWHKSAMGTQKVRRASVSQSLRRMQHTAFSPSSS